MPSRRAPNPAATPRRAPEADSGPQPPCGSRSSAQSRGLDAGGFGLPEPPRSATTAPSLRRTGAQRSKHCAALAVSPQSQALQLRAPIRDTPIRDNSCRVHPQFRSIASPIDEAARQIGISHSAAERARRRDKTRAKSSFRSQFVTVAVARRSGHVLIRAHESQHKRAEEPRQLGIPHLDSQHSFPAGRPSNEPMSDVISHGPPQCDPRAVY